MKTNNQAQTSEMLIEVWKMKEKVFDETKNMNCDELFNYINQKTEPVISNLKKKAEV